jgi:hypothetical protein
MSPLNADLHIALADATDEKPGFVHYQSVTAFDPM